MMIGTMLIAAMPLVAVAFAVATARREGRRRAARACPICHCREMVRVLARPPRDQVHYRRIAHTYRCAGCSSELFELLRPPHAGPLTGEQIDQLVAAKLLPTAIVRRH